MRRRRGPSYSVGVLLLLTACPQSIDTAHSEDSSELPVSEAMWEVALDPSPPASLSGVWGSDDDDVFIVGGDEAGGRAWHFDGLTWSEQELPPETPLLVWVHGFSPQQAIAVGVDGAAVSWDGSNWSAVETGTTEDLWGVWGLSPQDLWIVGGDADVGEPLILHFDGDAFTPVALAEGVNDREATTLFKVWGVGDTAFIVGQRGLILQLTEQGWVRSSGGSLANQDFIGLWGSSEEHIVAVGGRANGRIATWDGEAWETVAPSGVPGLSAVHATSEGQVLVGGALGTLGLWNGSELEPEGEFLTTIGLHAMWGHGGRTWAVGGSFLEPHQGIALVRTEP